MIFIQINNIIIKNSYKFTFKNNNYFYNNIFFTIIYDVNIAKILYFQLYIMIIN